jgi:predicted DNA-binding protein with PD1-like motif
MNKSNFSGSNSYSSGMYRPMARSLPVLLFFLLAASLHAAASVQGTFERTFKVTGPADLEVMTRSGDISVRSGPAGSVTIRGRIHVGHDWFSGNRQAEVSELEKNPPIRQSGDSIHIDYLNVRDISIDYEITAPADTKVRTHSGSGDQEIEGLQASLDLESGSGDMRLRDSESEIHLHTASGDVEGREVSGAFTAETGSGDIRLDAKGNGDVHVHTGSGNVELRGLSGGLVAETGSGDVSVVGVQTGTWEIRAHSGNVELQLPNDAAFDLDASTSSGEVVVGRPVTMVVQGRVREARRSVNGKVGGGGPRLTVHTGSGDIRIN